MKSNDICNNSLVLLVDDVPENIQVLHQILNNEGYSFAIAANHFQTFDLIEKVQPDLILLDIMLPGMDGFGICRQLKDSEKTADIPIIFLTVKNELEDKIKAFEIGAVDYITKPFDEFEVIARVRTHIQLKKSKDALKTLNQELEKEKQTLKSMSITDDLTKIYNRRYLFNRLNNEINKANRYKRIFSIIMIDIDDFKKINDSYGHLVGDTVLKRTADLLSNTLRNCDLIGRYGGEEFVIILPESNLESAFQLATRMKNMIENLEWDPNLHITKLTISCGLAEYKNSEKDFELLKRADDKLYKAKEKGKNSIEY